MDKETCESSFFCSGRLDACAGPCTGGTCRTDYFGPGTPCVDGHRDGWNASATPPSCTHVNLSVEDCTSGGRLKNYIDTILPKITLGFMFVSMLNSYVAKSQLAVNLLAGSGQPAA